MRDLSLFTASKVGLSDRKGGLLWFVAVHLGLDIDGNRWEGGWNYHLPKEFQL